MRVSARLGEALDRVLAVPCGLTPRAEQEVEPVHLLPTGAIGSVDQARQSQEQDRNTFLADSRRVA